VFPELLVADEARLNEFLDQEISEGPSLDYKANIPSDLAATVAAMANSGGGTVIVGVHEDARTKRPSVRTGTEVRDPWGQTANVLRAYLDPVPTVAPHVITRDAGGSYLVLVVSPSSRRVVLHREKGVLVRIGDQSVAPTRAEFERLIDRERTREEEAAAARSEAVGLIQYWTSADTTRTPSPIWITTGQSPVEHSETHLDETSDRAFVAAASTLLLGEWELVREPDSSTLKRDDEFLSVSRRGEHSAHFLTERPESAIDPPWAINAMDLAGDIACCLLVPFLAHESDPRLARPVWAAAVTISGIAARRVFFIDRDRYTTPDVRPRYPAIVRTRVMSEPADVVGLAAQVIADVARLHGVTGFDHWLPGLGPRCRP
jgi:hypothetical protein